MEISQEDQIAAILELYRLVLDKCYRMNLIKEMIDPSSLIEVSSFDSELSTIDQDLDNALAQAILPGIQKTLDKGIFDLYQVLYTIDVPEQEIKDKIMDLKNTSMIPSIIAFAIIDRLKERYKQYPLLKAGSN